MLNENQQKWLFFAIGLYFSFKNMAQANAPTFVSNTFRDTPPLDENDLDASLLEEEMNMEEEMGMGEEIGMEEEIDDNYGMPNLTYVPPGQFCPTGQIECCRNGGIPGGNPDCHCASVQDCINHEASTHPFACRFSNLGPWSDDNCVNVDRVASLPYYNVSGNKTNYFNTTKPLNSNGYIQFNGQSDDWSGGLNSEGETITYTDFTEEIP